MRTLYIVLLTCISILWAKPLSEVIPDELKGWVNWVHRNDSTFECNHHQNQAICQGAGILSLKVRATGMDFEQTWTLDKAASVPLPQAPRLWPQNILVNGRPSTTLGVIDDNGPKMKLPPGQFKIQGQYRWSKTPSYLILQKENQNFRLKYQSQNKDNLLLDSQGKLWLSKEKTNQWEKNENKLSLKVYRKLSDDIPRTLTTQVNISYQGPQKELITGPFLLKGFHLESLKSPMPAQVTEEGQLKVLLKTGDWTLTMKSRQIGNSNEWQIPQVDSLWPVEEIWAFEPFLKYRTSQVLDLPPIDVQQMDIKPTWKSLPNYLIHPGQIFKLKELSRGEAQSSLDEITLNKHIWLDFDGKGATIEDHIHNQLKHRRRLTVLPEIDLGSVNLNTLDQVITKDDEGQIGIEVMPGSSQMTTLSRLKDSPYNIPSTGWNFPVKSLKHHLHVPPGWKILAISGVDSETDSWLAQWDLWDFFLVICILMAIFKTMSYHWVIIGALSIVLPYHETHAPLYLWLNLIILIQLQKIEMSEHWTKIYQGYKYLSLILALGFCINFFVNQLRIAIYPQLELNIEMDSSYESKAYNLDSEIAEASAPLKESKRKKSRQIQSRYSKPKTHAWDQYQVNEKVQTGPGKPSWQWKTHHLSWSGPVEANQNIHLYMLPPWATQIIRVLIVLLQLLLMYGILRKLFNHNSSISGTPMLSKFIRTSLFLMSCGLFLAPATSHAQESISTPSTAILKELKEYTKPQNKCTGPCQTVNRMNLTLDQQEITLELQLFNQQASWYPLPSLGPDWKPTYVQVNNSEGFLSRQGNSNYLKVPPGQSRIRIQGKIPGPQFQMEFKITPKTTIIHQKNWEISGIKGQKINANSINFLKLVPTKEPFERTEYTANKIESFAHITRSIEFKQKWKVVTTVERKAPAVGAFTIKLPLLPNEKVFKENLKIENKHAILEFKSQENTMKWSSELPPSEELILSMDSTVSYQETWILRATSQWHIQSTGVPQVKQQTHQKNRPLTWKPLPGEVLKLKIDKPEAISGQSITYENAKLTYTPGDRSSTTQLKVKVKSSLGERVEIKIPEGAKATSLKINQKEIVLAQKNQVVPFFVQPGNQEIQLEWKSNETFSLISKTPQVTLSHASTNMNIQYKVPHGRWILYLGGPDLGPAMLYWGMMLTLILIAFICGKFITFLRLNTLQWFLLFIGLSTVYQFGGILFIIWFGIITYAETHWVSLKKYHVDALRVGLVVLTLMTIVSLVSSIPMGLLAQPDMQIVGNGSSAYQLNWFQDRSLETLPQGWILSLPLWAYRCIMLIWSMWLASSLIKWIPWAWKVIRMNRLEDNKIMN